jgi:NitT/TauT family transport system permease protein
VASVGATFLPADYRLDPPWAYIAVLIFFESAFIVRLIKGKKKFVNTTDLYTIIFVFFLLWDLSVKVFKVLPRNLLPSPQNVFYVFTQDWAVMLNGFFQSMFLIVVSVGSGMGLGIFFGLFVGWYNRAREAASPIINIIAAVPSLVYAPYVVAIAPTFRSASIIVIFMGIFFPTTMNMISNVQAVDKKLIDSAKSLNLSNLQMLIKILLPDCAIPLIGSLRIRVATAFMILTMAETIGANAGLGYYVKRWVAWADYTKTFAGIILIAVVVTGINALIGLFERKVLLWIEPKR